MATPTRFWFWLAMTCALALVVGLIYNAGPSAHAALGIPAPEAVGAALGGLLTTLSASRIRERIAARARSR